MYFKPSQRAVRLCIMVRASQQRGGARHGERHHPETRADMLCYAMLAQPNKSQTKQHNKSVVLQMLDSKQRGPRRECRGLARWIGKAQRNEQSSRRGNATQMPDRNSVVVQGSERGKKSKAKAKEQEQGIRKNPSSIVSVMPYHAVLRPTLCRCTIQQ
jgi:hypothetical protein